MKFQQDNNALFVLDFHSFARFDVKVRMNTEDFAKEEGGGIWYKVCRLALSYMGAPAN